MIKLSLLNRYTIHKVGYIYMGSYTKTRYMYIDGEIFNNFDYKICIINYKLQMYLRHYNSCPSYQTFKG